MSSATEIENLNKDLVNILYNFNTQSIDLDFEKGFSNIVVELFNSDGRLVKCLSITSKQISISTNQLNSGLYFIRVQNGTNAYTKRFVISK